MVKLGKPKEGLLSMNVREMEESVEQATKVGALLQGTRRNRLFMSSAGQKWLA